MNLVMSGKKQCPLCDDFLYEGITHICYYRGETKTVSDPAKAMIEQLGTDQDKEPMAFCTNCKGFYPQDTDHVCWTAPKKFDATEIQDRIDKEHEDRLQESKGPAKDPVGPTMESATHKPNVQHVANHPEHYANMGIEPIDYAHANNLDPWQFNVVKYVTRFKTKDGMADLIKCRRYVNILIGIMEGKKPSESK